MNAPGARISALYAYPVKGCRGIHLDEARLGERGLETDREWMVVDDAGGFLSQRTRPAMALIDVSVAGGVLEIGAPGHGSVTVSRKEGGEERMVTIWNDRCLALDQGEDAAAWLSTLLSFSCRLVRLSPHARRAVDPEYAVRPTDEVGFADGYPIHLLSVASVDGLNQRLEVPVGIDRFRPNLVIAGVPAHEEDRWRRIQVGEVVLDLVKPCKRCAVTTVDQQTGSTGKEPLRTLATYREVSGSVLFGQNAVHAGPGVLRVGAHLCVIE
jgi:uncharacterized protein